MRARRAILLATIVVLVTACGTTTGDPGSAAEVSAEPRPLSAEEAQRLAATGVNAYRAGMRTVEGAVVSEAGVVQIRGWIDTEDHRGYGLISGAGVDPFLADWSDVAVRAQEFAGGAPPLPVPVDGWSTPMDLDPEASHLAAAQVLLVSLADTAPENPQLLAQDGARWWRQDRVDDTVVDVMSGPIPDGRSESSFRYWIDGDGALVRLEARLDGTRWSSFTFGDAERELLDP